MDWVQALLSEFLGTAMLILLGNAVVANVVLKNTKGNNSGWLVISFGWGFAVMFSAFLASLSLGQINPAITLAFTMTKLIANDSSILSDFKYSLIPLYLLGQLLGAIVGQLIVYAIYLPHYKRTNDADAILATHSTGPAIKNTFSNLASEVVGTFILASVVLGSFWISKKMDRVTATELFASGAVTAGLAVFIIGLTIGGTTGYAINPVRDLIPRVLHQILPVPNKGSSHWEYAWIPVAGPFIGAALAAIMAGVVLRV